MRSKSYLLIILSFCLIVVLSACTSKEEKITSIKTEIDALLQAEKYEEVINKYEEIFEISDDSIYKTELDVIKRKFEKEKQQLEKENELISKLTNYRELLLSIQRDKLAKPRDDIHYIDLHYIVNDIKPMYHALKSIKFEKNKRYKLYVEKLIEAQSNTDITVSSLFTKDFATSSEEARRLDLPTPDVGGEIGTMLDDIETMEKLSKGMYIDSLDEYARDMLEVSVPNATKN
ncbi:hypothetical protein [Paenibacillus alvei]|uniref:Lipoprotein n=1 Tax=Paenibacillus alvei TaxID=44250 RepID=A0AAP6ZW80_PAEAL|nr:hypothetical protein [Paenibacillus alvei]NOJ70796.1 hypothetical protein [Paenibacillus alvei]